MNSLFKSQATSSYKKGLAFFISLLLTFSSISQTLAPSPTNPYCPKTTHTFTVTVPETSIKNGPADTKVLSSPKVNVESASIISVTTGGSVPSVITFSVVFKDSAKGASVVVEYTINNATSTKMNVAISFPRIKSLGIRTNNIFGTPPPNNMNGFNISSVTTPYCNTQPFTISFNPATYYYHEFTTGGYQAPVTSYDYLVPRGWKVNGFTSSGDTPIIASNNNVIITPGLIGSGNIIITPITGCANAFPSNVARGTPVSIPIVNRPLIRLVQNGSTTIIIRKGDNAPRTFTVENASLASCITEYQWNVANKGWLDAAGNPITTFITTTTPSLTLIPPCSGTPLPQDVEVVIKAGNDQLTSKVTVINSSDAVQLEISGPAEFCTSGSYNITGTTCNIDVTWEMVYLNNHPNVATISCTNCNSTTLTKYGNGTVLLRASVLIAGTTVPEIIERHIGVGTPVVRGWYNSPANPVQPLVINTNRANPVYNDVCQAGQTITNMDITANATVLWSYGGYNGTSEPQIQWYQSGNNLNLIMFNEGERVRFSLTTTNTCGSITNSYWFNSVAGSCGGVPLRVNPVDTVKKKQQFLKEVKSMKLTVSPNPASGNVLINLINHNGKELVELKEIRITDMLGNIKIQKRFSGGVQSSNINIGILKTGVYYVKVFNGFIWITEKLIVQ